MASRRTLLFKVLPALALTALMGCQSAKAPDGVATAPKLKTKPLVLLISDGFGVREDAPDNSVTQAATPFLDRVYQEYPHTTLEASGRAVGLPQGNVGSSEVGHMHIGGGRLINQNITRVDVAIEENKLAENPTLQKAIQASKGHTMHIITLWSDGGIHSHMNHTLAVMDVALAQGVERIVVHPITDGIDAPPISAKKYLQVLQDYVGKHKQVSIGTVSGRVWGMDRDKKWEKVLPVYDSLTGSGAPYKAKSAMDALEKAYARKEKDKEMKTTLVDTKNVVKDGDVVLYMNFRADRARALTQAFTWDDFDGFKRKKRPKLGYFATLTSYGEQFKNDVMFEPQPVQNGFGEYISGKGLRQLRIAETEKYAHVTYFFNGGNEQPYPNEDRVVIPSPKVASYDLKPEMSTPEIAQKVVEAVNSGKYEVIITNFANTDMVGHTGSLEAAKKAVESVDKAMNDITDATLAKGGAVLITSDHGNCEVMYDEVNKQPHVQHTTNHVPLIYISKDKKAKLKSGGSLKDVSPTMLKILGLPQPAEMTGESLISK